MYDQKFNQIRNEFAPAVFFQVVRAIETAVATSAKRFPIAMSMKDSIIEERVQWCVAQALMLRKVLIWSTERICDTLPGALDAYLLNGSWEPNEHAPSIW
jgi:hypothetical protein